MERGRVFSKARSCSSVEMRRRSEPVLLQSLCQGSPMSSLRDTSRVLYLKPLTRASPPVAHLLDHWEGKSNCVFWWPPQGVVLRGTSEKHSPEGWGFHPRRPVGMPTPEHIPCNTEGKWEEWTKPNFKAKVSFFSLGIPRSLMLLCQKEWMRVGETIKYMGWFWTKAIPTPHRFY